MSASGSAASATTEEPEVRRSRPTARRALDEENEDEGFMVNIGYLRRVEGLAGEGVTEGVERMAGLDERLGDELTLGDERNDGGDDETLGDERNDGGGVETLGDGDERGDETLG